MFVCLCVAETHLLNCSEGGGGEELCSINWRSFSAKGVFWVWTASENLRVLINITRVETLVENYKPGED